METLPYSDRDKKVRLITVGGAQIQSGSFLRYVFFFTVIWLPSYFVGVYAQTCSCNSTSPLNIGLEACYPFNGNGDDESGNNRHGTPINLSYATDRLGREGRSGNFNGVNTKLTIPGATLKFNNYSFAIWAKVRKFPASNQGQSLISIGTMVGDQVILLCRDCQQFLGGIVPSGLNTSSYFSSGPPNLLISPSFSDTSTWHHVVFTRQTSTMRMKLYLDGILINDTSISSVNAFYGTNTVGSLGARLNSLQFFNGFIDDARIYSRALSASEVMQLFMLKEDSLLQADAGSDKTICWGDSIQLNGGAGDKYKWTPAGGSISNDTLRMPYVKPSSTTDYIVNVTTGMCTGTDTVKINVVKVIADAGPDKVICLGDSVQLSGGGGGTYAWSPFATISNPVTSNPYAKPTATTKYVITVIVQGCKAKDTVEVTVAPLVLTKSSTRVICLGDSVQLVISGATNYQWSPSGSLSADNISNPYAKPNYSTVYTIVATSGGCKTTDSIRVNVIVITADAGADRLICIGDKIQLNASGGQFYQWTPPFFLSNDTIADPLSNPKFDITYTVTVTSGKCSVTDTITIRVNSLISEGGSNKQICPGDSVQLTASGGSKYAWNFNPTLSDTSVFNPFASPLTSTVYYVWVADTVCRFMDSVRVDVVNTLVTDAGSDTTICNGDSVQLLAIGGSKFVWTPEADMNNPSIFNPKVGPHTNTTFFVTGTSGACTSTDSITIIVKPLPFIYAGNDTVICKNNSFNLRTQSDAVMFKWTPSTYLNNDAVMQPLVSPLSPITYTVKATSSAGCINFDEINVGLSGPAAAFSATTQSGTKPVEVKFINQSKPVSLSYQWDFGDTGSISEEVNPSHVFFNSGSYRTLLTVTDKYGCLDTISLSIVVYDLLRVFIPNVFTANRDGLNEVFKVFYDPALIQELNGSIWNRWGEKIYEFRMPDGKWWDGKFEGQYCESDVYVYFVSVKDLMGKMSKFKGTVTLLR